MQVLVRTGTARAFEEYRCGSLRAHLDRLARMIHFRIKNLIAEFDCNMSIKPAGGSHRFGCSLFQVKLLHLACSTQMSALRAATYLSGLGCRKMVLLTRVRGDRVRRKSPLAFPGWSHFFSRQAGELAQNLRKHAHNFILL
jgi:hypothetical protein